MSVNTISLLEEKISQRRFDRLRAAVPRPKPKLTKKQLEERNLLQKKVQEVVDRNEALGWTRERIKKRSIARGRPMPVSTLNSIVKGTNPRVKTIEGCALAYDEDPVEWFKWSMDEPPDPDAFANSPIYRLWSLYQRIPEENLPAVNERIEDLVDYMRRREKP